MTAALRAHWRLSIVILLLTGAALAGFLLTREEAEPPDRYRVEVQLFVPAPAEDEESVAGVPQTLLQGQPRLALSDETTQTALDAAGLAEDERGGIGFGFRSSGAGRTITLQVTARDPEVASTVASTFRTSYVDARRSRVEEVATSNQNSIRTELERLRAQLGLVNQQLRDIAPEVLSAPAPIPDDSETTPPSALPPNAPIEVVLLAEERTALQARIRQAQAEFGRARIDALLPTPYAQTVEILPPEQITPAPASPMMPALAIAAGGIALAGALPLMRDRLDRSVRTAHTAARVFDAPVLAAIPTAPRRRRRALTRPGSDRDVAYRRLAAASIATDRIPSAIVVTSPTGEVQDVVAANLAAALARLGVRVALVATAPRQRWYVEHAEPSEEQLNFVDLLERAHAGRLDGAVTWALAPTDLATLFIVPPGETPAAVDLHGLPPLLEALSGSVDVTVIAGPSFLEDPDATIFAWTARNVLWAFEAGGVTEFEAKEAAARLSLAGASPFGVVMIAAKR